MLNKTDDLCLFKMPEPPVDLEDGNNRIRPMFLAKHSIRP